MENLIKEYQSAIYNRLAFNNLFVKQDVDGSENPLFYQLQLETFRSIADQVVDDRVDDLKLNKVLKSINHHLQSLQLNTIFLVGIYNNFHGTAFQKLEDIKTHEDNLDLQISSLFALIDSHLNFFRSTMNFDAERSLILHLNEFFSRAVVQLETNFLISVYHSPLRERFNICKEKVETLLLSIRNGLSELTTETLNRFTIDYDINLFNRECYILFKLLVEKYEHEAEAKFKYIYRYLRHDIYDKLRYKIRGKEQRYKDYITKYFGITLTSMNVSQYAYMDAVNLFNELLKIYEKSILESE